MGEKGCHEEEHHKGCDCTQSRVLSNMSATAEDMDIGSAPATE
jgi:hypothetical protein